MASLDTGGFGANMTNEAAQSTGSPGELDTKLRALSCTSYFDSLVFCTTPTNQMTNYYRHGKLDDCADAIKNLQTCMRIKFAKISNKEKARKMLHMSTLKKSPTIGTVWEAREKPSLRANPPE